MINNILKGSFSGILVLSFHAIEHLVDILHHALDVSLTGIIITPFLVGSLVMSFMGSLMMLLVMFATSLVMAIGTSGFDALHEDIKSLIGGFPVLSLDNFLKSSDHTLKGIEVSFALALHVAVSLHHWEAFFHHLGFFFEVLNILAFGRLHHIGKILLEHSDVSHALVVVWLVLMAVLTSLVEKFSHVHKSFESGFPVTGFLGFHHSTRDRLELLGVFQASILEMASSLDFGVVFHHELELSFHGFGVVFLGSSPHLVEVSHEHVKVFFADILW